LAVISPHGVGPSTEARAALFEKDVDPAVTGLCVSKTAPNTGNVGNVAVKLLEFGCCLRIRMPLGVGADHVGTGLHAGESDVTREVQLRKPVVVFFDRAWRIDRLDWYDSELRIRQLTSQPIQTFRRSRAERSLSFESPGEGVANSTHDLLLVASPTMTSTKALS
jgi:hypothetical protein